MKIIKVQTFYRSAAMATGDRWASVSHCFYEKLSFPLPANAWTEAQWRQDGVNATGIIQAGFSSTADLPLGNVWRTIVAGCGHLALRAGWQHVVISELDGSGVITDTEAFDLVYNVNLSTTNASNTACLPLTTATPTTDKILSLPSAVLVDKRVSPPLRTSNGRYRYQAGRTFYAFPMVARPGQTGTNPYSIQINGSMTTAPEVLTKLEDARIDANARDWPHAVHSAPGGYGIGDEVQWRPIVEYSVDAEVATQKKRLARDNSSSYLVP